MIFTGRSWRFRARIAWTPSAGFPKGLVFRGDAGLNPGYHLGDVLPVLLGLEILPDGP